MLDLLVNLTLLAVLLPGALWLGNRYADWLVRTCRVTPAPSARARVTGIWTPAALVQVAVVGDEVLVELEPVSSASEGPRAASLRLCGRTDPARIAAVERRCASASPVRYYEADASRVVLDVGSATLSLVGPAAGGVPR